MLGFDAGFGVGLRGLGVEEFEGFGVHGFGESGLKLQEGSELFRV